MIRLPPQIRTFGETVALSALALACIAAIPANAQKRHIEHATTPIEQRFEQLRTSPPELYAFLYRMPKGADLHNHLAGAVYAETFLKDAAQDHLCIDRQKLSFVEPQAGGTECGARQIEAGLTQTDNTLRDTMIDSLSMRDFVPGAESAHDHFFGAFDKFSAVKGSHTGEFAAEAVRRAADQNESYMELMALSGGGPISALGNRVGLDSDFDSTRKKLEENGLAKLVAAEHARVDEIERSRLAVLQCQENPDSSPCRVQVRYIFQVLREFPKAAVFAQVMAGFALAASDPRVVAVNLVQPEDGITSMRDYHLQMQMVDYAKRVYPSVHITLHAGELTSGLVPPAGLRFHIREAVELGQAERIGHGVDLMYERNSEELLTEMRDRRIAVEINLTSNDLILGVRGDQHPFPVYRAHGVPTVISTDDEGVSRTHLTQEFERAVLTYNLSYADVKELVRNSLEYSFAPGASYWRDRDGFIPVSACASDKRGAACREFLAPSEKARLEADLEDRFADFEQAMTTRSPAARKNH